MILQVITFFLIPLIIGLLLTKPTMVFLRKYAISGVSRKKAMFGGKDAAIRNKYQEGDEVRVPRMAGIILGVPVILSFLLLVQLNIADSNLTVLFILWLTGFVVGIYFDLRVIGLKRKKVKLPDLPFKARFWSIFTIATLFGILFYLFDLTNIYIPFIGTVDFGIFIIIPSIIIFLAMFASCIIDGIDGLSFSVWAIVFGSYGYLSLMAGSEALFLFSIILLASIVVYLRKNMGNAKWYSGETGVLSFAFATVGYVFLLENLDIPAVTTLPFVGIMFVVTVGSVILQGLSKKYFGRKIWLSTPIHHHIQAKGFSKNQIVLLYVVITLIFSIVTINIIL